MTKQYGVTLFPIPPLYKGTVNNLIVKPITPSAKD